MKYSKKQMDRLTAALSSAHQSRANGALPVDSRWRQNVMRSVRQLGPIQNNTSNRFGFSQLTWRLAPAALALMIILSALILKVEDTVEYQLASLMVNDPVETYVTYETLYTE